MEPAPAPDTEEVELWSHTQLQAELVYRRGMATLQSFSESMAMEQRVEMYVLVLVAICLCILFKILNVNNSPEKSLFYCSNQQYLEEFLKRAPELAEPYIPTRFWGYSGHLQTIIQVSQYSKCITPPPTNQLTSPKCQTIVGSNPRNRKSICTLAWMSHVSLLHL